MSDQQKREVERGNQCEMCDSYDDVKAVRDPEDNLLDMCADCRSGWPVKPVTDGGDRHIVGRDTCESCQRDDRPVRSILMKTGDRELLCEQCFRGRLYDDMVDPSDPRVETTEVGDV